MPQENRTMTPVPQFSDGGNPPPKTVKEELVSIRRLLLNATKRLDALVEMADLAEGVDRGRDML